ncbi:MAG: hypothetical protein R3E84_16915 [Pseudomonadales bacterium]
MASDHRPRRPRRAQFVICANGTLSEPKLSRIAGMETFAGRVPHLALGLRLHRREPRTAGGQGGGHHRHRRHRRAGGSGLGASAKALYVFQRTPSSIDVRDDWETDPAWAARRTPGWQAKRRARAIEGPQISPERQQQLAAETREEKIRRQEHENIDYMMRIHRRIEETVHDKATAEALKPWYMFMCKRPCFHNDYLPTFNLPSVHLVDTHGKGVTEITAKGPLIDGVQYELDLLIYATGFEVQKTGIYNRIVGRDGLELEEKYRDGIRTLLGIHTHGFPNLFIMGGYQASFQFNLTDMLQTQGDHIAACIDYVREHGFRTIDATDAAEEWWVQEVIAHRGKTSRNQDCTPGYYNFEGESNRRQDGNYNGGFKQYFQHQGAVRARMQGNFDLR